MSSEVDVGIFGGFTFGWGLLGHLQLVVREGDSGVHQAVRVRWAGVFRCGRLSLLETRTHV